MSNVRAIRNESDDVVTLLEGVIDDLLAQPAEQRAPKAVVLLLDDRGGTYGMGFRTNGMRMSELVALCRAGEMLALGEMGFAVRLDE